MTNCTMKRYFCSFLLLLTMLAVVEGQPSIGSIRSSVACKQWVDSVYNTLTDRERIAQLFVQNVRPSREHTSNSAIKNIIADNKMGGVLLNEGVLEDYVRMVNYIRSLSDIPALITLDGEWGLSMRIRNTPRFPHNMALGAIDNDTLLYEYGREVARECRIVGVNVNFAPVLDVNSNPSNPVIGYRSFGEDPERVSKLGIAYAKGLEDGGVLSVAKHFPGHGDTSVDSHKDLPIVTHSDSLLKAVDLLPFQNYINAGLSSIMVGHLNVPAIDNSGTPTSLSKKAVTDLLCDEMGFEGLIFTDALSMKGAKSNDNNCVRALLAGVDVLLATENPSKDLLAVENAINTGLLSKESIEEKCKKILSYKYALGLHEAKPIDIANVKEQLYSPEADAVNRKLSAALMTVLFNKTDLLPIKDLANNSIALVNIGAPVKNEVFSEFCAKYAKIDTFSSTGEALTAAQIASIKQHDIVIVGVYSDKTWAQNIFAQLKGLDGIIPVFFMNPYKMNKFNASLQGVSTLVLAYDDTPYIREYAAQAIFGGIDVNGTLPVNLKNIAPMGTGVKLKKIRLGYVSPSIAGLDPSMERLCDSLINIGLETKAFSGCQLLVAKDGNVVYDKSCGYLDISDVDTVSNETLFDLASVSKATGTLPGIMKAYEKGLFELDVPVSKYIPGLLNTDKKNITVRELLYHESGMPPSLNMFDLMMDTTTYTKPLIERKESKLYSIKIENGAYGNNTAKLRRDITAQEYSDKFNVEAAKGLYVGQITMDTIMQHIYNAKLRDSKKFCYSCLNFCLLMDMEQRLTGKSHDEWVYENIFAPLGSYHTCYRPLTKWTVNDIASTEYDSFMRKQTIRGYVHDELADFSGGVQGNAGLFSNAEDLAKLCQMWLNGGEYGGERILSEDVVKLFTTDKSPTCRRGLGFDKPDMDNPDDSPTCEEATAATYGHLGFTGTVFWVYPDNGLIFIFLFNRVNPTRNNVAFSKLNIRPKLFSVVYNSIIDN